MRLTEGRCLKMLVAAIIFLLIAGGVLLKCSSVASKEAPEATVGPMPTQKAPAG